MDSEKAHYLAVKANMIGIAGILSPFPSFITQHRLAEMCGSDQENCTDVKMWIEKENSIGFACRATTFQYLHYTIAYDGCLYNAKELQVELEALKYSFPMQNEANIIMASFDYWKEKCLEHLDGSFAFALYNEQDHSILITRDRLGEKPMYYYADFRERGHFVQLIFATEIKALWRIGSPQNLDATMVFNYLTLGYTTNPHKKMGTFYADILSLPPGNYLKIYPKQGRTQMRNWYRPKWQTIDHISDIEAIEQFSAKLDSSIIQRAQPGNHIGLYGNNSLNIAAIAQTIKSQYCTANESPKIFTSNCQLKKDLKQYCSLNSNLALLNSNDFVENFDAFCAIQEMPVASYEIFSEYISASIAHELGITTWIDDLGAEEVLGGHSSYIVYYMQYLLRKDFHLFLKEWKLFQQHGLLNDWKWNNFLHAFLPEKRALNAQKNLIKKQKRFPFLKEEFILRNQNETMLRQAVIHQPEDAMFFDLFTIGIENKLTQKEKIAAAFSLAPQYPFLQYNLVEYMFSLPTYFKFHNGYSKWILKASLENRLSKNLVWQNVKPKKASMPLFIPEEKIYAAKQKLVDAHILNKIILGKKEGIHPEQQAFNWRILNVAYFIENRK